mgnify:CR=1 FL=1
MVTRQVLWILVGVMLVMTGCARNRRVSSCDEVATTIGQRSSSLPVRLDRGDWLVDKRTAIWAVDEEQMNGPSRRIGYLVKTQYRQLRGGPLYETYDVTTLNRREKIGRIDQVGRATRFVPRRNQGFDTVDEGVGTLEDSVAAIFQTPRRVILTQTTERRLAFEAIDKNADGYLDADETRLMGDRIPSGDQNGDGKIDFQEFDALDQL